MFRRFAPLAIAASLVGAAALFPATALAEDEVEPTWFDNGVLHFAPADGLFVTTTNVRAPEGPVDVITVRPQDEASGTTAGPSFITITVFHQPLPGEGTQADIARETIISGVRGALRGATVRGSARDITLGGQDVEGTQLSIRFDGSEANATVAAVEYEGATIVYYDQRHRSDRAWEDAFNSVGLTLAFGPAPEPVPPEEAADDEHGDDEHGDDGHGDDGHGDEH